MICYFLTGLQLRGKSLKKQLVFSGRFPTPNTVPTPKVLGEHYLNE